MGKTVPYHRGGSTVNIPVALRITPLRQAMPTKCSHIQTAVLRAFSLAAALLLLSGCASAPAPAREFVAQAQLLHDDALSQAIISDRDLEDYIQQIGQRIIAAASEAAPDKTSNPFFADVQFHLVDSDVPNVFATGGKHIYVYAGLFKFCQNEEELATAMSQAYAHLVNLDIQNTSMKPDDHRPLRADVWQFVINPFSSEQDLAADRLAFQMFDKAGWDGTKFENLFQRVNDTYHSPPRSQPLIAERACRQRAGTEQTGEPRQPPAPGSGSTHVRHTATPSRRPGREA